MASLELVALDTATPQLRAPGGTDTYAAPKDIYFPAGKGIFGPGGATNGIVFPNVYDVDIRGGGGSELYVDYLSNYIRIIRPIGWGGTTASSDVALARATAKVLKVTDASSGAGALQLPTFTVANLPTAANAGAGGRASVSDATQTFTSANFGTTVTGGGANFVPVVSDGTNWKIG